MTTKFRHFLFSQIQEANLLSPNTQIQIVDGCRTEHSIAEKTFKAFLKKDKYLNIVEESPMVLLNQPAA